MIAGDFLVEGGCDCGAIRYRMTAQPLFVHWRHCRWCQRETGAAFALNAMIEADRVEFIRVGTLDDPDQMPPDIRIFTRSKQPWVVLPSGTPAAPEYHDLNSRRPAESLERRQAMRRFQGEQ